MLAIEHVKETAPALYFVLTEEAVTALVIVLVEEAVPVFNFLRGLEGAPASDFVLVITHVAETDLALDIALAEDETTGVAIERVVDAGNVLPAEQDAVALEIAPTALTLAHVETTRAAPVLDIPGEAAPVITIVRAAETVSLLSITFLEQVGFAAAITPAELVIMLMKELFPVIALPILNEAAVKRNTEAAAEILIVVNCCRNLNCRQYMHLWQTGPLDLLVWCGHKMHGQY